MTDAPSSEASEPAAGEASQADPPDLGDLRFVGSATEAVLADASIDAATILDRGVSFVQMVQAGVEPGVAARLRREYSLPWSDEPTRGARLRRRASHVRHLRDDERSWIDESGRREHSNGGRSPASAPDGSGRAIEAEQAWRERSQPMSLSEPDTIDGGDAAETETDRSTTDRKPQDVEQAGPPINPSDHTVPEIREAIDSIDEPEALAAILRAERSGEARKTALEAIEERLEAIGVDPAAVPTEPATGSATTGSQAASAVRDRVDPGAVKELGAEKLETLSDADITGQLTERLVALLDGVGEAGRRYEAELRDLRPDEWRQVSFALLLGFVALNLLVALVVALGSVIGPPAGALPLFIMALVAGVISYPLRWWDAPGGYHLTLLTGAFGVLAAGLIAAGAVGSMSAVALPLTLPVYGVVAAALITATYLSRPA